MRQLITGSILSLGLLLSASGHAATGQSGPAISDIPTGEQPKWLTTESPRFPRIDYFSRRGQGKNPEAADHAAEEKLIKLLNPSGDIPIDSIPALSELQVLDRWLDNSSNTYWSYLGLPQQSAADHLRAHVQQLDDNTTAAIDLSQSSTDPLQKIGAAHRAFELQQRRAIFQEAFKTVDLTGRGAAPRWQLDELDTRLQALIDQVQISAGSDLNSPHGERLQQMLRAAFKTANITQAGQGDFVMQASLDIAEERQENNWILARGVLKLSLLDANNLAPRGEKEWQIDIMGLTANSAISRVLEKAEFRLKKNMRTTLVEFGAAIPAPVPASAPATTAETVQTNQPNTPPEAAPPTAAPRVETPAATAIPLEADSPISAEPL